MASAVSPEQDDVNNRGQVVGFSTTAINDLGQVTGFASTPTATHAFFWSASTGMVDLGTLGDATQLAAGDLDGSAQDDLVIDFGAPHGL
jgi:probable HAF family extracellular repeat protein